VKPGDELRSPASADERDAYERLLGDAMNRDATLFAREDAVEVAWKTVEPVLDNATPVEPYEKGVRNLRRG